MDMASSFQRAEAVTAKPLRKRPAAAEAALPDL
jgi:hypothetical protein